MPGEETSRRLDNAAVHLANEEVDHDRLLSPDRKGRFQRQPVSSSALHERLVEEVKARLGACRPRVVLCCGKCRVGSTPLANVFGHAGLSTFYQPIKTLLRYLLVEQTCPDWTLATSEPVVFIKETFGPYVEAECQFNPLRVLLDAGFRAENITLLVMERDPLTTLASWRQCWHERIDADDFVRRFFSASSNAHRLAEMAKQQHIGVEYYLHEESKHPQTAMPKLFESLGLGQKFQPSVMQGWTKGDSLQGTNTAVTFFRQPEDYWIEEIHLDLDEYRFVRRRPDISEIIFRRNDKVMLAELNRLYFTAQERAKRSRLGCSDGA